MKRKLIAAFALMILASSFPAVAQEGSGLKIDVGEPFTIFKNEKHLHWGSWNFPELRKCADGSLLLRHHTGGDRVMYVQEAPSVYRSHDLGKTWQPDPMGAIKPFSPRLRAAYKRFFKGKETLDGMCLNGFCNLSDGTSVAYHFYTVRGDAPTRFINCMWHSPDGGKTWKGPVDVEVTALPNKVLCPGAPGLRLGPHFWRRSVQLDNGDLVTTVYCCFEGDKKYRVIALVSSDKGRKWRYLATVAHDETINPAGFTEAIICKLAGEELICFIRTKGHYPMYQSYSRNGGKTWTKPVKSGVDGVAPDMHLLSNGVLACSYGRPGNNIMFSADGDGRDWTDHTGIYGGYGTGYTSFEEVSPGRLFLVFDVINYKDSPDAKPANCIRGVYVDVQRRKYQRQK